MLYEKRKQKKIENPSNFETIRLQCVKMQNSDVFRLVKEGPKSPDARLKELTEFGPLIIMTEIIVDKETEQIKEYRYFVERAKGADTKSYCYVKSKYTVIHV